MNKKVLGWIVVLLVSLLTAAGAAVWLIVVGLEADLNSGGDLSLSSWLYLALSASAAVGASLVLLRMTEAMERALDNSPAVDSGVGAA
ncbi:hypothetical protein A20C1_10454 [marine actinobacterium PHSC20C1]|nr:hypothetical protein A20C1_10454 [marine actinobacterium PHSC20C1]